MADQIEVDARDLQPGKDRLVKADSKPVDELFAFPYPYVAAVTNHGAITEVDWFDKQGTRHNRMWEQHTRVTVLRDGPEQPRGHVPAYHYARTSVDIRDPSWKVWLVSVAAVVAAAVVAVLVTDPAYHWIWQDWRPL